MTQQVSAPLPPDRIDDDLELLVSVAARLNRTTAMLLSSLAVPLTFRQYRTLTRVAGGYTSLRQLASRGNLSLPTVSENVDGLVRRGLMTTTPSEADRRAIILHVTEGGQVAANAGRRVVMDLVGSLLADFSAEERTVLQASLQDIYESTTDYFDKHLQAK